MRRPNSRLTDERGFTLVEIIAVLVILGILASMAIPKYMDTQSVAQEKVAQGAIAEIRGRLTFTYVRLVMLNGGIVPTVTEVNSALDDNIGPDFSFSHSVAGSNFITIMVTSIQGAPVNGPNYSADWNMP